jgi:hypothetical protein
LTAAGDLRPAVLFAASIWLCAPPPLPSPRRRSSWRSTCCTGEPEYGSEEIDRVPETGIRDYVAALVGWRVYLCRKCRREFYGRRL